MLIDKNRTNKSYNTAYLLGLMGCVQEKYRGLYLKLCENIETINLSRSR